MSKPRIFINIHYLEIGGAEMALLGLLYSLDPARVDVDLFVNQHTGEFMPLIPRWVNLLPENPRYATIEKPMKEVLLKGHVDIVAARLCARYAYRHYIKTHPLKAGEIDGAPFHYVARAVTPLLPSLKRYGTYDLAISFLTPHQIVSQKVDALKKVAWIHTDYSISKVNAEAELPVWDSYDYIAAISEDVKLNFLKVFPTLAPKVIDIENILSARFVAERANEFDATETFDGEINLLSIGRFCEAKNYDNVPDICRRLVATYPRLKWYIIGYGGAEQLIRQKIAEAGMEDHVILLGKRENPYPYIKACDVYVQPSRYEGKSVTVREAQMLRRPVIVTDYPTAKSQISDGVDGVIVPMDNDGCAQGIARVLADSALRQRLIARLTTHDHGNESEVQKIYSLLQ